MFREERLTNIPDSSPPKRNYQIIKSTSPKIQIKKKKVRFSKNSLEILTQIIIIAVNIRHEVLQLRHYPLSIQSVCDSTFLGSPRLFNKEYMRLFSKDLKYP